MQRTRMLLVCALLGLFAAIHGTFAAPPSMRMAHYAVTLSTNSPRFDSFVLDSLGEGKVDGNPILPDPQAPTGFHLARTAPGMFVYTAAGSSFPLWRITCIDTQIVLRSEYLAGHGAPFVLSFDQKINHATLLGLMRPGDPRMPMPCVLHLPDLGSARISCTSSNVLLNYDARRWKVARPFVRVEFPPASADQRMIEYRLDIGPYHPYVSGIREKPRYDGFRRGFLNIFQVNPRLQMLANNSSSDAVPFTLYEYAELARSAPDLSYPLTCMDLVRMTLDRYLDGVKGYGQPGYGSTPSDADIIPWTTPWTSLDTYPSLLIAASIYVDSTSDTNWARARYDKLLAWSQEMLAADKNGNGLLEYPGTGNYGDRPTRDRRPANWWDTINFGHEDAYANALAYYACRQFSSLARNIGHDGDADSISNRAERLRSAYLPTLLNKTTGLIAGWRSADGELHDYAFPFVQGAAIVYGLVETKDANKIMDRLLKKMAEVHYTNFSLGLPGNLIPIRKGDYVQHGQGGHEVGEPTLEDGSDAFQIYENGGSTACFAYYTAKALYELERKEDARRIYRPLLESLAAANFQGFCSNGRSRDWRDWKGGCHGYEGLLVDNYFAFLAVFDDALGK